MARVLKRLENEGITDVKIRVIVIYTGDVQRDSVSTVYDIGSVKLFIEGAFLSELDSDRIRSRLTEKINNGESLTDEEIMEFIILPLTYKKDEDKKNSIKDSVELAKKINDEGVMTTVLAGMLVFTDKIIDDELGNKIKEWIMMTKVARLFEEEKELELAKKDKENEAELAKKEAEIARIIADNAEKEARIKELEALLAQK